MSTSKTVEYDDLKEQLTVLRKEIKDMADLISIGVSERAAEAKDLTAEQAADLTALTRDKASQLHSDAERAISGNPLAAIAIFAGIGFLIGAVSRR